MAKKLLMGNEAFAHAALEAGVRVVAGYPGTPSSELIETVAKLHAAGAARGVHVEWSTNEKAALELLAGASYAGARCLFTCKQVGLNVASDALMSLNYVGVKGGLVLFVADDPGPISSQTEQDTRRFASFAKLPVLDPSTPDEGFAMMQAAFDLSERYRTPVIVRPTTRINHASTFFDVADATDALPVPPEGFERDPKWVIFPRRAFEAHGEINDRLRAIAHDFAVGPELAAFNPIEEHGAAPRLGIVAGGVSAAYAREALRMLEERAGELPAYRFWQVGTPYPFPTETAARFADGLEQILVLEELDHVLEDELLRFAGRMHAAFEVRGKLTGDARDRGENDVDDIAERIAKFLGIPCSRTDVSRETSGTDEPLPVRPPVLCAGCPHRGSFYAVKRALGKAPAVLCGDIGCYTLGNAKPLDAVDTCLCMGAGITMAQGFAVAEPHKKTVAFVGDSTFFASGLTGIANAVYNGHDITVCVLDNATTAMTGSQPHPGTGFTLMGPKRTPISIERVLEALGVECIVHADPLNLDASIEAAREAIAFEGPSAILFESPCVQLVRPDEPAAVDADACTGCKKCITEIGCPAIGFDPDARGPRSKERGQAFVDPTLCNGCALCTQVCPFDALAVCHPERAQPPSCHPERAKRVEGSRAASAVTLPADAKRDPSTPALRASAQDDKGPARGASAQDDKGPARGASAQDDGGEPARGASAQDASGTNVSRETSPSASPAEGGSHA
ncbi:indolepyruvate ferredoxin oxidoreductase subunit alpha [Arabiibacter massiliensis]|uniref:indolepyruvate ferredoxin oxidoreductase subunit alpha n=1 Tax=Arabiibacter massiliensis TaxID=1870985 RepID=UPI001E4124BC|nr:indolepyruvate ferredoxin oxidoreductase subunit alpha [Arabiibacter massiliensis]